MIEIEVYINGHKIPTIADFVAREIARDKEVIEMINAAKARALTMPRKKKKAYKALIEREEKLLLK